MARDALNEIDETQGISGKSYHLRLPNSKKKKTKVQNMIYLLRVEVTCESR